MVDPILVPHHHPLIDKKHIVYFSNANKTDLWDKIDYYRNHIDETRRIAVAGYLHAMKFHRAVNLIDYILRTAHVKKAMRKKIEIPTYTYTGQYLNKEALAQKDQIKLSQRPGNY